MSFLRLSSFFFFFFNDTATTEIYPLSLHDALPISTTARIICLRRSSGGRDVTAAEPTVFAISALPQQSRIDRKSTRLNSSHVRISYAVFCLKKKKIRFRNQTMQSHFNKSSSQRLLQ